MRLRQILASLIELSERLLLRPQDREWLRAVLAEQSAMQSTERLAILRGLGAVLGRILFRRLLDTPAYWVGGLAAGLLVAVMGLTLDSLIPHLVVLVLTVSVLSAMAPEWAWRWALLIALPKPLLVEAGWYGPYFYDRFDAYYAVVPALTIAFFVSWARGHFLPRTPTRA